MVSVQKAIGVTETFRRLLSTDGCHDARHTPN